MTMGVSSQRVFADECVAISIDCFVALLLAMTISLAVIARLPEREAVAISIYFEINKRLLRYRSHLWV